MRLWPGSRGANMAVMPVVVGPIGLEFAQEQLNLVQLQRNRLGELRVRCWASQTYPYERDLLLSRADQLKTFIKQSLRGNRFQGQRVVSVLPSSTQKILSVSYQLEAGQSDSDIIIKLLHHRLPGELSDYVIDFLPVRSAVNEHQRHAVVAVAPQQTVIAYLESLRIAGVDVQALEIGPAAIKRLVAAMSEPVSGENVLVVNFGADFSYLTMISGRRLLFDEQVEFGELTVLQQMADILDMSVKRVKTMIEHHDITQPQSSAETVSDLVSCTGWDSEINATLRDMMTTLFRPMVEEVKRALIYAASETRGDPVKHLYILGSIARWRGADTLLGELLDMSVELIPDPLGNFQPTSSESSTGVKQGIPEIAVATGLALRGFEIDG